MVPNDQWGVSIVAQKKKKKRKIDDTSRSVSDDRIEAYRNGHPHRIISSYHLIAI